MNVKMRALAALASSAIVTLLALPAFAGIGGYCDPEVSECPPGPPSPPPLPTVPTAVNTSGNYAVSLGTIASNVLQQGYYQNGMTTYFGGGPFHPIGGDGVTLTVGQTNNSFTFAPTLSPLGAVSLTAIATTPQDPIFTSFDLVARGDLTLGYLVDLHAKDQAAADALAGLLSTSGAIAHISGDYSLTPTGSSWGTVSAQTGTNQLASGLQDSFFKACSLISYGGAPADCGGGSYSLALNFVSGSAYSHGDPLDFISVIQLSASANAGPPNLGWAPGTFTAFIDPQITFAAGIDLSNYSLTVGGVDAPLASGGVPEPSTWAMMLAGFCGIGLTMRRRQLAARLA